ncbi:helix-turn-helix domain-containing protein [Pasteurellaceae bacterium TAE3-ERU1]|nr:helix-turn-helix domain-containing protein [Pasteurellaceae bacterium TAE3-ERU1]
MGNRAQKIPTRQAQAKRARVREIKGSINGASFFVGRKDLFTHANYYALSKNAKILLVELLARYNGKNNGDLAITYDEVAQILRISRQRAFNAFKELEEAGFIVKTRQGNRRECSLYAVTCYKLDAIAKINQRATHSSSDDWKK